MEHTYRKLAVYMYLLPYVFIVRYTDCSESSATNSSSWTYATLPNPQNNPRDCGMSRSSWICNPDHMITAEQAMELSGMADFLRQITGPSLCKDDVSVPDGYRGYQIAVLIIKELPTRSISSEEDQEVSIDTFSFDLRNSLWLVGNCEDGIVVVLSTENEQISTNVGGKVSSKLTKACIQQTNKKAMDDLNNNHYFKALKDILQEYTLLLQKNATCHSPSTYFYLTMLGLGVVVCGVSVFLFCFLRQRFGVCKSCTKKRKSSSRRSSQAYRSVLKLNGSNGTMDNLRAIS